MIIWANQTLRIAMAAVERLCAQVATTGTVVDVEPSLARLDHLFALLDYDELRHAEQLYSSPAVNPGVS
jgi:phosphoenolpyruvate phosphomutase